MRNQLRPAQGTADLSIEDKRKLLGELLRAKVEPTRAFPVSFAQQRLWFLEQLEPGSPTYAIPLAFRLRGPLAVEPLRKSLEEIVRRHEVLRTTFAERGGEPVQVIHPAADLSLDVEDLRHLPEGEWTHQTEHRAGEEAVRPFHLSSGPLFRARLLRLEEEEHVLLLSMHHIVSDGWSLGVLFRELSVLYDTFVRGLPSPLEELPVQYADVAMAQREHFRGEVLEAHLSYWREQLADAPAVLELPTDHPRPAVQNYHGQLETLLLPPDVTAGLRALAQQAGVTPYMVLLAAFQVLLSRYSGQDDLVVGSPIAGRTRTEMEGLIGLFANTLALRADLSENPTFVELLAQVRERTLGAYQHQELPFERLVEELGVERSLAHNPVFQVMLVHQDASDAPLEFAGLRVEPVEVPFHWSKFDLALVVTEGEGRTEAALRYRTDLFEAETAARLLRGYSSILLACVAAPHRPVGEVSLLTAEERRKVLVEWNAATASLPSDGCLHELFEAQAESTPGAVAVVSGEERISYAGLNARADQLASCLRRRGVGPEMRVGVCLERGIDLVVSLLAVLKAGGAYVPLDPSYPAERLRLMLEDSGARLLVTREVLLERLPELRTVGSVLWLDEPWEDTTEGGLESARSGVCAQNLAYVIYTSGSTGTPKGVMIQHGSAALLVHWARTVFPPDEHEALLASTSVCFDLSVFELFYALSVGRPAVIVPDALHLSRLEPGVGVTLVNTVPSAAMELLRGEGIPPTVRTVNLAGEPLTRALAEELYRLGHVEHVYNLYGPSEDTTYSTWARVEPGSSREPAIGRPVANTRAYVLDAHLEPTPVGVPGELYLGGDGLARGYLARPARTAECFLPDPFSGEPGARLYRTGDRVRWHREGELEFLGRVDHQVKVRGFRIELGEIEAVLLEHEAVREAVVVAREDGGEKHLVAYFVPEEGEVTARDLRQYLGMRLPAYMVPGVLVMLKQMPLTSSGKVDRRSLPAPEHEGSRERYVPPRTPTEELLAVVLTEVLPVEQVGAYDDFFELGGHSLIATRVVARVREIFGIELPLRVLFEAPTVAALAERVEAVRTGGVEQRLPLVRAAARGPEMPASFAQQRLWLLDRLDPGSSAYVIPASFRFEGPLEKPVLERAFGEVVRRHESLRTTFEERDGVPVQVVHPPAPFFVPVEELSGLSGEEREAAVRERAREEAERPFDLSTGPLFRASLLRLEEEEHVLLLSMHHIVSDGWSLDVLFRELSALYDAFVRGLPSPLEELPVQYADYALWQREHLSGAVLEEKLAYWKEQLAGAPPLLELPTDFPRPAVQSYRGEQHGVRLSPALTMELKRLARREGATLYMVLLAAFQVLLSRLSGQADVVVGSPIAGRTQREVEGLIGFFVNTLALRADLSGDPTFREVLAQVRERTLGAYQHQELPFERLVEELGVERSLAHNPLFQVMFNLHNFPRARIQAGGISSTLLRTRFELGSKFDLTLYAVEEEEQLHLTFRYNAGLFDRMRMVEMLEQYTRLLSHFAGDPTLPVGGCSLVTARAEQVLPSPSLPLEKDWHGTVGSRLAMHARRAGERLAVEDGATRWSYHRLEERSNQLAHHLRAEGIGAEDVVAIYGHRSAALVWAVLGVLKAGAAFTILDPAHPAPRSAARLHLARPRAWLQLEGAGPLPDELVHAAGDASVHCRLILAPQGDTDPLGHFPCTAPEVAEAPDDLAYVAFTSGTTGEPKAILGTRRPLSHFLEWQSRTFGLHADDRFALLSGLMHDPLLRDVLQPLWAGGSLHVPASEALADPQVLGEWLADREVSVLHLTPGLGRLLADGGHAAAGPTLSHLRYVFFGGDVLTYTDVARLHGLAPRAVCVNLYGATETPQGVGYHIVEEPSGDGTRVEATPGRQVPLGRGVPGSQLLVCTPSGRLAGIGELGEICVRSPYLARGYVGGPGGGFEESRFTRDPGDRLYRTGDLGRYRCDGTVEICGRSDRQVKVRGFRVEPGEVEAVLRSHPSVKDAVVAVRSDGTGERQLAAYVVPTDDLPTPAVLRAHLRERLPEHMVPVHYVPLERIPLTLSGKVDHASLPDPVGRRREESGCMEPRAPEEEVLAAIWADALGLAHVGAHENFFELGGHSLVASRVVARTQEAFHVALPLRLLFEAPTVARFAAAVRERKGRVAERPPLPELTPDAEGRHRPFPLTPVQQAYWVGRQEEYELGNVATFGYFELDAVDLDLARYTAAWQRLIHRHGMLRAVVLPSGEQQVLESVPCFRPDLVDLRGLDPEQATLELQEIRDRLSHQVRDTSSWPLFHLQVTRIDRHRSRLHFGFDALTLDAWSRRVLLHELVQLYTHPESTLEPLEVSFRDYVLAERALTGSEAYRESERYWDARLDTLPPAPDLPLTCAPSAVREPRFARRHGRLDPESWHALRQRASRAGLTPSGVLLAAYAEVLGAWSKSPRFTLNLTVFNRLPVHPQVDRIAGDFTSTVLLAVEASPGESFESRSRRLQLQLWDDLNHPLVSGIQVLRRLARRRRDFSQAAMPVVFTSTLNFSRSESTDLSPLSALGKTVHAISQTPQVWLDHQVGERKGALLFNWDAVEELFPDRMLDDMFDAYCRLLHRLASEEEAWQEPRRVLVPRWQQEVIAAANATDAPLPRDLLHTRVAARASREPRRPAVVTTERTLSYGEVHLRSAWLGLRLREMGASPNRLVAVVMEKGWEQVVAVLAVLHSGAAYVPIDPSLPTERIHHLLHHSGAEIALTQPWVEAAVEWPAGVRRVPVEGDDLPALSAPDLAPVQQPEDLAYVIYTSGSTGLPKGVMIDHRGAVNTIADLNRRFRVEPADRVLALSSLSFDLSVYDIFGLLSAGGTVVIPDASRARDPAHWAYLVKRERVTLWNTVPQLMEMLVNYTDGRPELYPSSLRLVMMSGDWIPVSLPDRIRAIVEGACVYSLGGATEASIWSILYPVERTDPDWKSIPYGKAMVNQRFYVFDAALEPRPVWVPGPLYIGGAGVALGYWGDEEKTCKSFVHHPRTGERLYHTGDLGRYLPDGNIEFLGREDFQVKVQGHRIELGEIETNLVRHPAVHDAVVVAREDGPAGKHLVAYIVALEGDSVGQEELRTHVAERLPHYMVPSAFVMLQAFPLSSNGKVDRKALPAPRVAHAVQSGGGESPRTPTEKVLAELWSALLGTEAVGVHDSFFELGGDSVLATRLVAEVRAKLQVEFGIRTLFAAPTIAGLARELDREKREGTRVLRPGIRPAARRAYQGRLDGETPRGTGRRV